MEIVVARTIQNQKLDTRTARLRIQKRREPYFVSLSPGCALGYRAGAGIWIARYYDPATRKKHYQSIGAADDVIDSDGRVSLSFTQAQEKARDWFKLIARNLNGEVCADHGPYTVAAALDDYFRDAERRGAKGVIKAKSAARLHISQALGATRVEKLTASRIKSWHAGLLEERKRGARDGKVASKKAAQTDAERLRARKASANRILTILKAALNYAYHEGKVATDEAWRKVKPFREVDAPVIHYLQPAEVRRLVNACHAPFRHIVRGALLTGARYGELTRMRVCDFNPDTGSVAVRESKAGRPRHIALNDEGRALFVEFTSGKSGKDLIFSRADGAAWGASHQQRPLEAACKSAIIDPPATFHILRHTYASTLAMEGVPMGVIAAQLGHADTRMTERHYAHLAPNYIAETIRASLPAFGIAGSTNVTPFIRKTMKNGLI